MRAMLKILEKIYNPILFKIFLKVVVSLGSIFFTKCYL